MKASEITNWKDYLPTNTKKKKKKSKEDLVIPLPKNDPGFFKFCKYFAFPRYAGLFRWQKEHHNFTWKSKYEETLVPRGHGKSVEYMQKYEWAMLYHDYDVLLLGWTDRRKQIALDVYAFFRSQDLIEDFKSPYHFKIKNGGKFDCYLITSKETLGMHSLGRQNRFLNLSDKEWKEFEDLYREDENKEFDIDEIKQYIKERAQTEKKLWVSIDDPIDTSFIKERHKEINLELHFTSSLYPIHPDKWSFTGTHKFIGDFFTFIEKRFGDDLVIYKKSTMNEDGTLLCPEMYTHPSLPTYKEDLEDLYINGRKIRGPKLDLEVLKKHAGPFTWWSEYEQDPHPISGEIWDHIKTVDLLEHPVEREYDISWISIDRATTMKTSSSYTGCVIGLRHKNGFKVITHDWTKHTTLEELLLRINNFIIDFHKKYKRMRIIIVVEKQGGGDDFLEMCRSRVYFMQHGKLIQNKIPLLCQLVDLHNTGEKKQRIHDRLFLPIKNEMIGMMSNLENSEIYTEILQFPYSNYLDAIDSLANAEYELQKIPLSGLKDPFLEIGEAYERYEMHQKKPNLRKTPQEKEAEVRNRLLRGHRRNVTDDF